MHEVELKKINKRIDYLLIHINDKELEKKELLVKVSYLDNDIEESKLQIERLKGERNG